MTETIFDPRSVEQGSELWHKIRLGHVTASHMADVMSKGKGNAEAIGRYKYKVRLVAERITDEPASDSYSNEAMLWGVEQEQFACIAYEENQETFVTKTGFWLHPTIQWLGVSPDRLVGDGGLIEVKCPNTTTHLNYLFDNEIPANYYKQIQCQLWVTGRQWCDFVSFDPRLPKRNQLLVIRTQRDEKLIKQMEEEVVKFLSEVESLIIKLGE
jgi:putative phage-type endonuclease